MIYHSTDIDRPSLACSLARASLPCYTDSNLLFGDVRRERLTLLTVKLDPPMAAPLPALSGFSSLSSGLSPCSSFFSRQVLASEKPESQEEDHESEVQDRTDTGAEDKGESKRFYRSKSAQSTVDPSRS